MQFSFWTQIWSTFDARLVHMLFVGRIPEKNAQKNAYTLLQTLCSHALILADRIWGLTQLRAMYMALCCSDRSSAGAMFLECRKKKQQNFRNCCWSVGTPPLTCNKKCRRRRRTSAVQVAPVQEAQGGFGEIGGVAWAFAEEKCWRCETAGCTSPETGGCTLLVANDAMRDCDFRSLARVFSKHLIFTARAYSESSGSRAVISFTPPGLAAGIHVLLVRIDISRDVFASVLQRHVAFELVWLLVIYMWKNNQSTWTSSMKEWINIRHERMNTAEI